ncbi:dipeptidase [Acidisphaera rubrifaciens]|nr:dipeptidase [Acidisphaera rubrifaciens]
MDAAPETPRDGHTAIHARLLALDTHIDIPWPEGPGFAADGERRVDLPKMRRGGLAGGFFAAFVPQTVVNPANEQAAFERARAMLLAIRAMGDVPGARLATTADAIEQAWRDGAVAVVPAVENGFAAGTDLDRLGIFRSLGATYVTMTHNGHNALADAAIARPDLGDGASRHGGLSALGREAVAVMNRLGLLIDVSHAAKPTMMQLASLSATPVVATHSCMRALCDHPRNLDDEQLDVIRDVGGVVQVTAVSGFVRLRARESEVTVADFCNHIDYAVRRIGIAHVGIGSDFDGGGGFVGWRDAADSPNITAELLRRGYEPEALAALWGGNFLRVMRQAEAVAAS